MNIYQWVVIYMIVGICSQYISYRIVPLEKKMGIIETIITMVLASIIGLPLFVLLLYTMFQCKKLDMKNEKLDKEWKDLYDKLTPIQQAYYKVIHPNDFN